MDQIRGSITHITFRNPNNGWTVAKLTPQHEPNRLITVVGAVADIKCGDYFLLSGQWAEHPQFGKQFKFERSEPSFPDDRNSIIKYLGSGILEGVGDKTAEKIYETFGDATFNILNKEPFKLHQIEGLGRKKVAKIIESWKEKSSTHASMAFLTRYDISLNYAQKILKTYGDETVKTISENPYQLIDDIRGIGFIKADEIALKLGLDPQSLARVKAAIQYTLKLAQSFGHCYLTQSQLEQKLSEIIKIRIDQSKVVQCLDDLVNQTKVVIQSQNDHQYVYASPLYYAETYLAAKINLLLETPIKTSEDLFQTWITHYNQDQTIALHPDQVLAISQTLQNKVFILTGGPGVGKTTTTHAMIHLFRFLGKSIALAAPTGRAAQRMNEATKLDSAKTIHRLLEWLPDENRFKRDQDNPILADVFIIDEASMLDVQLASALFAAIPTTSQVILIGDSDQLPAVGPGNVLSDLLAAPNKIAACHLHEVFRQAEQSKIIRYAHSINKGNYPNDLELFNEIPTQIPGDCFFIQADTPNEIQEKLQSLIQNFIPKTLNSDPTTECQILTPMNRGPLGTQSLNQFMQQLINPHKPDKTQLIVGETILRKGDKVIQMHNNYEHQIFNGDIGTILETKIDGGQSLIEFNHRIVKLPNEALFEMQLAYAITIHKSQGSEFPIVIIPLSTHHYIMLQRNLIYTALTRARRCVIFLGSTKALQTAVRTIDNKQRQTLLTFRLN